jgi:hypothetical protein
MYKSYVLTKDKTQISPRLNIGNRLRVDTNPETIDIPSKSRVVLNRYSSVKQKDNRLAKSDNLPSINNPKPKIKKMTTSKNAISSSFIGGKLPEISKRFQSVTTSDVKDIVNDKGNFGLFCKLYEIWLDIELNFDNRQECINLVKYYFRYIKEEILNQSIETDEFNFFVDSKWNLLFLRIAKLQGIVITVLLIVLSNFPENNLGQIRKMTSNISNQLITFLDDYVIDTYEIKPSFIEKINYVKSTLRPISRNNVIALLLRNQDHCFTTMKSYM